MDSHLMTITDDTQANTIQNILVDLKVVSMVEPTGKLCVHNGVLLVESFSILTPIKRYLSNNNRYTICRKIKYRIIELETLFLHNHIKEQWIKDEITRLIEPLKNGIMNLRENYSSDSQMCANFDLMISRIKLYFRLLTTVL